MTLALGLLATHSLLAPAPGPVAAAAILGADFGLAALLGLLVALVAGGAGWLFVVAAGRRLEVMAEAAAESALAAAEHRRPAAGWRAALPILVPILLLILGGLSQMPNAPLGGGPNRDLMTGLARPVMLLVIGGGLALILLPPPLASLTEKGSIGAAIGEAAGVVLIVGAAGAFAKVLQNSGLPESAAEALAGLPAGILVPFLIAATLKTVQGSSLVAVIMAAGFTQPLLGELGLDGEVARALAAVAIGARIAGGLPRQRQHLLAGCPDRELDAAAGHPADQRRHADPRSERARRSAAAVRNLRVAARKSATSTAVGASKTACAASSKVPAGRSPSSPTSPPASPVPRAIDFYLCLLTCDRRKLLLTGGTTPGRKARTRLPLRVIIENQEGALMTAAIQPMQYLDKALSTLRDVGLVPASREASPMTALLDQITALDQERVTLIARTLDQMSVFNEVVREQISADGDRRALQEDHRRLQLDPRRRQAHGRPDRGRQDRHLRAAIEHLDEDRRAATSSDRFDKIKRTYLDVAKDTKNQIEREHLILEAYRDFRGALKESEVMALEVLKTAEAKLAAAKQRTEEAAKQVEAAAQASRPSAPSSNWPATSSCASCRTRRSATRSPRTSPTI